MVEVCHWEHGQVLNLSFKQVKLRYRKT